MGSFKGHVVPGSLFLLVGVWHTWSAVVRHVSSPRSFRVRVWSPVPGFDGRLKHLELYVITIGAFIDLCIELLYSPHLKWFANGILNPSHMNNFEHSGMLVMFFIFGIITLLSEKTRGKSLLLVHSILGLGFTAPHVTSIMVMRSFLPLPEGALCLIAATAFSAEYLLFYYHSTTHKGLEGYYHLLLVLLIGLCIASCVTGALLPTSFAVDLCNGVSITLQGLWFFQTAFTLYGPMMPDGCRLKGDEITCNSTESQVRGEYLANFQLFALVLGVFIAVVGSYGFAASRFRNPDMHLSEEGLD